jgi:LysR family transcriptional regulator, hca operon transcriptional activator
MHSSGGVRKELLANFPVQTICLGAEGGFEAADLIYKVVTSEPLVVILPSDHFLASRQVIDPKEIAGERLLSVSTAPALREVIDDYLKRCGIDTKPELEADSLAIAMSLVASTRSVALLPAYVQPCLPWSVISRLLSGNVPTIDLVVGYNKANASPILKLFLSRLDDLIARVSSNRPAAKP